MCNGNHLDDDLSGLFGGPDTDPSDFGPLPTPEQMEIVNATYTERCKSCGGSGRFRSWSGRDVGPCHKCKGKGSQTFRSSPEARAKGRASAAAKKERESAAIKDQAYAWALANSEDAAWIRDKEGKFDFATAMAQALDKYGSLTERQHATVTRLRLADEQRNAARNAERASREATAPTVDTSKIEEAFAHAQGKGIKRPKMVLNGLKFSPAPATGRNAGSIYVVEKETDQYLGKITGGRFFRVRECTEEKAALIAEVVTDPKAAAIAYGQRTGECCICSRELTNHASIDLGIGPICASRMGW